MLSVNKCRELTGQDPYLSDEQLERMRDQFYSLANVILDGTAAAKLSSPHEPLGYEDGKHAGKNRPVVESTSPYADVLALLSDDDRYEVEVRISIHKSDGDCTRVQAERLALDEHWKSKLTERPDEH